MAKNRTLWKDVPGETDENGVFRFDGVMPGNYVVVAGKAWDSSSGESTWREIDVGEVVDISLVIDLSLAAPEHWNPREP